MTHIYQVFRINAKSKHLINGVLRGYPLDLFYLDHIKALDAANLLNQRAPQQLEAELIVHDMERDWLPTTKPRPKPVLQFYFVHEFHITE